MQHTDRLHQSVGPSHASVPANSSRPERAEAAFLARGASPPRGVLSSLESGRRLQAIETAADFRSRASKVQALRVATRAVAKHWGLLSPVSRQRGGVMASRTLRLAFQRVDPVTLRGLRGRLLGIWGVRGSRGVWLLLAAHGGSVPQRVGGTTVDETPARNLRPTPIAPRGGTGYIAPYQNTQTAQFHRT
jgi:hypothetical protein